MPKDVYQQLQAGDTSGIQRLDLTGLQQALESILGRGGVQKPIWGQQGKAYWDEQPPFPLAGLGPEWQPWFNSTNAYWRGQESNLTADLLRKTEEAKRVADTARWDEMLRAYAEDQAAQSPESVVGAPPIGGGAQPVASPYVPEPLSLSMAGGAPSTGPYTDPTKLDLTLPEDAYQVANEGDISTLPPLPTKQPAEAGETDQYTGGEDMQSAGLPTPGQAQPGDIDTIQSMAQSFAQGQVPPTAAASAAPTAAAQPTNLREALRYKSMDAMIATVAGWPGLPDVQKEEIIAQLGSDLMADRLSQSKRGMFNQPSGVTDAMLDKVDWTNIAGGTATSATPTTSTASGTPNAAPVAAGINKILADAPPPPKGGGGMDIGKLLEGKTVNEALIAISNLEGQFKYVSPAIRSQLIRELRQKKPGDVIKATGTFSKQIVPVSDTPQDMQPTIPGVMKDFGQAIGLTGGVKPSAQAGS